MRKRKIQFNLFYKPTYYDINGKKLKPKKKKGKNNAEKLLSFKPTLKEINDLFISKLRKSGSFYEDVKFPRIRR